MNSSMDDFFGALNTPKSTYTAEEIDAARKQKRKPGATLLDTLADMTGKVMPSTQDLLNNNRVLNEQLDAFSEELRMLDQGAADFSMPSSKNSDSACSNGKKYNYSMEEEIRRAERSMSTQSENLSTSSKGMASGSKETYSSDKLDSFVGLKDDVSKIVLGQEDFVKKLVVAFKRPFVMKPKDTMANNSIFITGPACTGKHLALDTIVLKMNERKILTSSKVHVMDLSIYPNASEEKLFLQDLYEALASPSEIIVFENYEKCHTSLLARISDLVIKGKCYLSERYTMNKGQLVTVNNGMSSSAVGTFEAKGKYFVFISSRSVSKLSDAMGAPFINALGDICETKPLAEDTLKEIAHRKEAELVKKAKENALFELTLSEEILDYSVSMSHNNAGLKGILDFYEDLLRALCELRLNGDYKRDAKVLLSIEDSEIISDIDGDRVSVLSVLPGLYTGELEAVKKEMDSIVGLSEIKEYIFGLEEYFKVQKKRKDAGLKASELNKHMIFTGNPGTGKTTIARIISRYLKAIGVLTGGQLVEVSRADLVGRYVGHTAPLTNQVISSAIGGVLFIDEAYSLYRGKDDSFGMEAIDTLVKGIEDNRDNLIVILAGYSKEMEEFLSANSGLKSRFPNIINFPDYTGEELLKIAEITAGSKGYVIDEGVKPSLLTYFNAVQATRAKDAGNGRLVRNKIEDAILNQSRRLVAESDADLSTLTSLDFELDDI